MLTRVIEGSIRHRGIVLVGAIILSLAGLWSLRDLPLDAFPDTTPVQVVVNTVAPSLAPLEIERQITAPLEQAIGGLPGLVDVRSLSKFGFSQIVAVFEDDVPVYLARQVVDERIAPVELPAGVARPSLGPVATGLGEIFQYLVQSDTRDATELRTLHHWVVRPQLAQVPGVAEVTTWGGYEKQYHAVADPERLLGRGLTLDDLAAALRDNNDNVGGGSVDRGGEAQLIQGVGRVESEDPIGDIEAIVVAAVDGVPILVGDVAVVREGHEIRRGAVTAEGRGEAVLGLGFMLMGENSRIVTQALDARLAEAAASLPDDVTLTPVYRRTDLIDEVLTTVRENLVEAAILVVAVLFIFLGNLRAGLLVALVIPLSMIFAFNGMLAFGIAGSLMSLGAIDFGLVVDSSVIMVEHAASRVAGDETGAPVRDIVRDAALEVRRPTLFGELIIAVVYLPILTLEGIEGKMFRPMAGTVILALLGSMVLSVTLMPALASWILSRRGAAAAERARAAGDAGGSWVGRAALRVYRPVLDFALRRRIVVVGVAVLLIAQAAWLGMQLGSEFIPRLSEQAVVINTVRRAGVSLDESVRYGTEIERRLLAEFPDEIAHIWTRTGTAEVATDPMGLEVSDVFLTLAPRDEWRRGDTQDALVAAMTATLEGMPGMRSVFTQPIELRLNEMVAGSRADLGVKLFGDDFEVLKAHADQIARVIEAIPGADGVSVEQVTGLPILRATLDRAALARHGVSGRRVLELIEAMGGAHVGEILEGERRFDLVVRLPERFRDVPGAFGDLEVVTATGARLPLRSLAEIEVVEAPATITRDWGKRRVVVQTNVRGRDVGGFVDEVTAAVAEVPLPPGYYVRYSGQFEHMQDAEARLLIVVPLALLLVLGLLYLTFGSARDALLVATGVPFAIVGGVVALWLRDMPVSISAAVGFIAVSGVAVLGQLVLVSRARQLAAEGRPLLEATREAAQTRLRPVLMTALVAAIGFLPMALNTGVGGEVQRPLATVVVGGVLTSLMATLLLLPALYSALGRRPEDTGGERHAT